jgi:hypothetical protein
LTEITEKMKNNNIELFKECWKEHCTLSDKIQIHNVYIDLMLRFEDEIFYNDEDFFDDQFPMASIAVRSCYLGNYKYSDTYVWFNTYGNLESGSFESDMPFNDVDEMSAFFISHYEDIEYIKAMNDFVVSCKKDFDRCSEEEM